MRRVAIYVVAILGALLLMGLLRAYAEPQGAPARVPAELRQSVTEVGNHLLDRIDAILKKHLHLTGSYRLDGWITLGSEIEGQRTVVLRWQVADTAGKLVGRGVQSRAVATSAISHWRAAPQIWEEAAAGAARGIAALIAQYVAQEQSL